MDEREHRHLPLQVGHSDFGFVRTDIIAKEYGSPGTKSLALLTDGPYQFRKHVT